jgi:hypothetical protein
MMNTQIFLFQISDAKSSNHIAANREGILYTARTVNYAGLLAPERPDAQTYSCFPHGFARPCEARATPNVTSFEKEGEEAADAQPTLGGGDTEARQQKVRKEMQYPIYF